MAATEDQSTAPLITTTLPPSQIDTTHLQESSTASECQVRLREVVRLGNINDLPREVLHMIFETFNTYQGKRRGKLSLLVQQYIRDPNSVSYDKGYECDRTAIFQCLNVCRLWRDIVLDVLFAKSYRCWTRKEKTRKHLGLIGFIRDAECFRSPEPEIVLSERDLHKKCRWRDTCACEFVMDIAQCPYRDFD